MRIWDLHTDFVVASPLPEVFEFFADAGNLEAITPPWLRFRILTPTPIEMRAGTRIDYRIRIRGWPVRWRTEITAWEPPVRFVDEQLRGPYRIWIHEHRFESVEGGTRCRDHVRYAVPGGALVHRLLVKEDLRSIFAWREARLRERFGAAPEGSHGSGGGAPRSRA